MLEGGIPEGTAAGSNPVAPRTGGGGAYQDYTLWSMLLLDEWAAGVAQDDPEKGGYLYGEIESRFSSRLMLPPNLKDITSTTHSCVGECCHIHETCGVLYMGCGDSVYKYDEDTQSWQTIATFDFRTITDIIEYDGILHVGTGPDQNYSYINLETGETGQAPHPAQFFYTYAGLLYAFSCNEFRYTNGSLRDCDTPAISPNENPCADGDPPTLDVPWCWEGPIQVGPCDPCCCITGAAGAINGALNSQVMYISTCDKLYVLLPGDVLVHIVDWPQVDEANGRNMRNHFGSTYIPVGHGAYRMTASGDLIEIGLDRNEGLPCDKAGKHVDFASTANWLLTYVDGEKPSVWAYNNEGWHFVACLPAGPACGMHYSQRMERLFLCTDAGMYAIDLPQVSDNPLQNPGYEFRDSGFVDLGTFHGGLREIEKDFHSVFIHGECITPDTPVRVYWAEDDDLEGCVECEEDLPWRLLGEVTQNRGELIWDCAGDTRPATKDIRLKIELATNDPLRTPVVDAIRVKYLPMVTDSFRWSYIVELPPECLEDMEGCEIEGYNQDEWDCCMIEAITSIRPVSFEDIDGKQYHVKVLDYTRRVWDVSCEGGEKKYRISYFVSLQQTCPERISC